MNQEVVLKKYSDIEINLKEALRYMGCSVPSSQMEELAQSCVCELKPLLDCSVLSCIYDIKRADDGIIKIDFPNAENDGALGKIQSRDLCKNLEGCDKVVLFAATIGFDCDRLLARYKTLTPSRAVAMQAVGAAAIEALCDRFCDDLKKELSKENISLKPRFSPGYGDFALSFQKDIFTILECNKRMGLTLKDSFLMIPSKSVTAVIGLYGS